MAEKSIKRNTVYNAIKTLSSIIFPLITFPYISRVLLPENVGKINFGLSIVSYFTLIATLGITTYAVRECSAVRDDKEKLSDIASQIFSINIVTTIIAYVALAVTLLAYNKLENYRLLIVIQSLTIAATTLGADWLNTAMEDFRYITVRTVAFQFVSLVLMFVFVHKPEHYMRYAVISLISSAGANILNVWYRKRYCNVQIIWDLKNGIEWKRHLMPIMLLFVMILAQTILNSVDSTMLGLMHGDRDVGIYTTAHKMQNIITQVIVSIAFVVMPRMSSCFAREDYEYASRLYRKVFGFFCTLGLPCIAGTCLLADDIIAIAAGDEFAESAIVLVVLMLGFIPSLFGGSLLGNIVCLPSRREKVFMIACCVSAVVNIITNYLLIPNLGAAGAALTTFFCNAVTMIILIIYRDRRVKLENITRLTIIPIIGCVGICFCCLTCRGISSLWIRTIVSVVLSILVYTAVQYFGKNELLVESFDRVLAQLKLGKR